MEEKLSVLEDFIDTMVIVIRERIMNNTRAYIRNKDEKILDKIKKDFYLVDEIEKYLFDDRQMIYEWYENEYKED